MDPFAWRIARLHDLEVGALRQLDQLQREALTRLAYIRPTTVQTSEASVQGGSLQRGAAT
jgi:hypothetical protein